MSQDNLSLDTLKGGQGGQGGGRRQQGGVSRRAGDVVEVVMLLANFNLIMTKDLLTEAVGMALSRPTCSVFSVRISIETYGHTTLLDQARIA